MKTQVVAVDPDRPDPAILDEAAAILQSGGLVAFGTETVYGLGADATNPAAVARIFAAKGRPATNPLIVHVADADQAADVVGAWPWTAGLLAGRFWPGPLTLVLPRADFIADLVTAGQETVGVRVPAPAVARELIRRAGVPIAAPSANRSNRISPTTAAHVLKDLDGAVDLILDSGPCSGGIESTVLDLSGPTLTVLRPGLISAEEIAAVLGEPIAQLSGPVAPGRAAASPGQLAVHYAPQVPAYRLAWSSWRSFVESLPLAQGTRWGIIALGRWPGGTGIGPVGSRAVQTFHDPWASACGLYEAMHTLDTLDLDFILIITPPDDEPGWEAVLDRVRRATRPWDQAAGEYRLGLKA